MQVGGSIARTPCCDLADCCCSASLRANHPHIPCLMPSHRHCRHRALRSAPLPLGFRFLPPSTSHLLLFMPQPLPAAVGTKSVSVSPLRPRRATACVSVSLSARFSPSATRRRVRSCLAEWRRPGHGWPVRRRRRFWVSSWRWCQLRRHRGTWRWCSSRPRWPKAQCAWTAAHRCTTSLPAPVLAPITGSSTWRFVCIFEFDYADPIQNLHTAGSPTFIYERNKSTQFRFCLWKGGGWCRNPDECAVRKGNFRGSSKFMKPLSFSGILGGNQKSNPDFYNWNRVKIRYCDGSSFTGDVEAVDTVKDLRYRGFRVWRAVIDDLLTVRGMSKAQNGSAKNLPASCTSKPKQSPELCMFPQYVVPTMRTPLFILNAAYDSWQVKNVLAPSPADPKKTWAQCKLDIKSCSASQLTTLQNFRTDFLAALPKTQSVGMFIDSCNAHCQSGSQDTWLADGSPTVNKTQIGKAVGDWYYDREVPRQIDCPYPCNPTCKNRDDD
ncbi:Pectin acetylesterase 8 [Zea mays]|uniref:Pectin acetylesterase n=1 Tax=Zea mays TaxID=4577 RepID=A0A3L6FTD1_MAIZE|nr:Pectin acetylesterase 8 [Zea mays]